MKKKTVVNDCIPSTPDERDYTVNKIGLVTALLADEYITPHKVGVLNQGKIGSCVPHSIAVALAYQELVSGRANYTNYSRGFIYGNRRDGDSQKEGMMIRQALRQLRHCGDCVYSTFPWNEKYASVKARIELNKDKYYEEADDYRILNYFRCYTDEEIKTTIKLTGAAILAMPLYSTFAEDVPLPTANDSQTGFHAMCCVGWDKKGWIIQNSWGKHWGNKGFCHVPYDYPIVEWWGITLNKNIPTVKKENKFIRFFKFIGFYIGFAAKWLKGRFTKTNKTGE